MSFKKLILSFLAINGFVSLSAMEPNPLHISNAQSYLDLLPAELLCNLNQFRNFKGTHECEAWLLRDIVYHKESPLAVIASGYKISAGSKYLVIQRKKGIQKFSFFILLAKNVSPWCPVINLFILPLILQTPT